VSIISNSALHTWKFLRGKIFNVLITQEKSNYLRQGEDILTSLPVSPQATSQCTCISKHQIVHLQYILFVSGFLLSQVEERKEIIAS
jgi:hypothetical protein